MKEKNDKCKTFKQKKKIIHIHSPVVIKSWFCLIKYGILLLDKNKLIDNTALQTLKAYSESPSTWADFILFTRG